MKVRLKWLGVPLGAALLGAALLGGCAPRPAGENPLRGVAASIVAAHAFDRAQTAIRRDDSAALERAGSDLRRASEAGSGAVFTTAFAAFLSAEASEVNLQAAATSGAEKARLLRDSDAKYRAALAFAPQNAPEKSLDANTLNSLGYFLADRGQTRADFERGAQLTLAAYQNWPMQATPLAIPPQVSRATGPQDSYAWALFKLGKLAEAKKQEQEALEIARQILPAAVSPEIPFHFAEILRASGETERARREYNEALKLSPDAELKAKIESGLARLGK